jgi:3-deoxy-D-manno-octulosonic-acid transferase
VSDRSLPGYLRFQKLLQMVMQNVNLFLAQSEEDARRLIQIGAPAGRVRVSGNLKFEVKAPPTAAVAAAVAKAAEREEIGPVIVAGSTLEGEEQMLLAMLAQVAARYSDALLVLAPRHPQRFDTVASLLSAVGLAYQRRSRWEGSERIAPGVLLLDTIGELASLYQFADLAFVGGSLVPRGGHNVLEAAQFGRAILVGPHTENFRDIVNVFRKAGALQVVTPETLAITVLRLLESDDERELLGRRALEVVRSQQGATQRTVEALRDLLPISKRTRVATTSVERRS